MSVSRLVSVVRSPLDALWQGFLRSARYLISCQPVHAILARLATVKVGLDHCTSLFNKKTQAFGTFDRFSGFAWLAIQSIAANRTPEIMKTRCITTIHRI